MTGYKFIKPKGIENLKNWSYKSGEYTHLDNAMQPFWNWFVTLFPTVSNFLDNLFSDGCT